MDETDTSKTTGPDAVSADVARQWAEQRRLEARAQFDTPSWIGPSRGDTGPAVIPAQPEPEHDEIGFVEPAAPRERIPDTAHWAKKNKPRVAAGTVLVLAVIGTITFLVLTVVNQSAASIAGLAASAFVAVIFRGALVGAGTSTVDLHGSVLRIRSGGRQDDFNLADPMRTVEVVGTPDLPTWRVLLETLDGRTIVVDATQVDPHDLHRIVTHYRAIAHHAQEERERRFNR